MTWKNTGHVDFGTEFLRDTGTETFKNQYNRDRPGESGTNRIFFFRSGTGLSIDHSAAYTVANSAMS
jgi:hypothetical protein